MIVKKSKLTVRPAVEKEINLINRFLIDNWSLDLKRLFKKGNVIIYVFEGYFNEIYAARGSFIPIINQLIERNKHPYALGLHMGRLRKKKFLPSLELGYIVSTKTNTCVIVNEKGEENFLYGKDLLLESIIDIKSSIKPGQIVIVLNRENEYIGLGRAINKIIKIKGKVYSPQRGFIIENIIDLGWYLRKGG